MNHLQNTITHLQSFINQEENSITNKDKFNKQVQDNINLTYKLIDDINKQIKMES